MKYAIGFLCMSLWCFWSGGSMNKQIAPYGSWPSAITAERAATAGVHFSDVHACNGTVYWLERRPFGEGYTTLVSWNPVMGVRDLLSAEYNVRSRVHEYGGGALLVVHNGIYFVNYVDQAIYLCDDNGAIQKIISRENTRFADGSAHPTQPWLFYVQEEHTDQGVINTIVKIDISSNTITTIASGNDFYASPRVSPDGRSVAYITWNHPNMPWDDTSLYVCDLETGLHRFVAGGDQESVLDPQWSPNNALYYVSDRSNWWNIYKEGHEQPLVSIEGECAHPHWAFGRSLYGIVPTAQGDSIICSYLENDAYKYAYITPQNSVEQIDLPYSTTHTLAIDGTTVAYIVAAPDKPDSLVLYDMRTNTYAVIAQAYTLSSEEQGYISIPSALEIPVTESHSTHAFYYPPTNPHYVGLENETPPLLVMSHGGPTGYSGANLTWDIIYWTSRGFAVLDVNYGGSTGYGRAYRECLKGQWGIIDVEDCTQAALYCVEQGLADGKRLTIMGGSAGGFTTLAVLAFKNVFKVGANYFGVSDLERFILDTHKFEAHYLDGLVGLYPETRETYHARSPLYNIEHMTCPVIIFQGDQDTVVPPSQSEMIYTSLKMRNIPTQYFLYEGEGHGFRQAKHVQHALETQRAFFMEVLQIPR